MTELTTPPISHVGDNIRLQTDSGTIVSATIEKIEQGTAVGPYSVRRKVWSRWSGTVADLFLVLKEIAREIETRSGRPPMVDVATIWKNSDAEQYSSLDEFETALTHSAESKPGTPDLQSLSHLEVKFASGGQQALSASLIFSSNAPALQLELIARDRVLASGLRNDLAGLLSRGSGKIPSPNQLAFMIIGAVAGFLYYLLIDAINFDFLPRGFLGTILFFVIYIGGYISVLYGIVYGTRLLLPPLKLASATSELSRVRAWLPKAIAAVLTALLGAFAPFLIEKIFG